MNTSVPVQSLDGKKNAYSNMLEIAAANNLQNMRKLEEMEIEYKQLLVDFRSDPELDTEMIRSRAMERMKASKKSEQLDEPDKVPKTKKNESEKCVAVTNDFEVPDGESQEEHNFSSLIQSVFRRNDRNSNLHIDEDEDECMEASFGEILAEERKSAKIGLREDLEEERKQEEEKRRRMRKQ